MRGHQFFFVFFRRFHSCAGYAGDAAGKVELAFISIKLVPSRRTALLLLLRMVDELSYAGMIAEIRLEIKSNFQAFVHNYVANSLTISKHAFYT